MKTLQEAGEAIQIVRSGEKFQRRSDGSVEIDPNRLDDYLDLFSEIRSGSRNSINILHLASLADRDQRERFSTVHNQNSDFFTLLHIAQAIGELDISLPIRIGIISNEVHEVTGEETLDPRPATALGLSKVIPKEFPNVTCFNIDLSLRRVDEDIPIDTITRILSEFGQSNQREVIAYRGSYRWEIIYERVKLQEAGKRAVEGRNVKRLRDRGVYLITGGTGGLGLAFAKYLARACQARLVLTRRTAFPEKSKWRELLAAEDASGPVVKTIQELLKIERLGGEVEVFVSDVSDPRQMDRVLRATLEKFNSLNGVIHAAGILRSGLIQTKTKETVDAVLLPKVQGTWVLFDLLRDVAPDFLVLFSSMASVTGPHAHSDYSAANAFLDAFAYYANSQKRFHTLSINWPVWKEVGVVARLQAVLGGEEWKEEVLKDAIRTEDGVEAFKRALNSNLSQVIVSPGDLNRLQEPIEASSRILPNNTHDPVNLPGDEIEHGVTEIWKSVLGLDQIGIRDQFLDLGGHSLLAMQIVARIRAAYQIDFSLRNFFATPTIGQLSSAIRGKMISQIDGLDHVRQNNSDN